MRSCVANQGTSLLSASAKPFSQIANKVDLSEKGLSLAKTSLIFSERKVNLERISEDIGFLLTIFQMIDERLGGQGCSSLAQQGGALGLGVQILNSVSVCVCVLGQCVHFYSI